MKAGISAREFAKRDGCSNVLVSRAILRGKLKAFEDGTLNPADVGTAWRDRERPVNRRVNSRTVHTVLPGETPTEAVERIVAATPEIPPRAASEARIAFANALLRELEYDQKSAAVVSVGDNVRLWVAACTRVRTRLLAIPAEQAPRLHHLKTVGEVQDALLEIITQALAELSRDGLGPMPEPGPTDV